MSQPNTKSFPKVRKVNVSEDEAGQRIDNFLARYLKGVPKSHIYRILRRGEVRVNSGRIRAQYKVRAGDTVRIPPVRVSESKPGQVPGIDLEQHILFENPRLLVINKPPGIAVHGGSGLSYGIIEALRAGRATAPYLELGHRLDRETSGCLVIAKRRSFLRAFHEQLQQGQVKKLYLALVDGQWQGSKRTVDVPLRKNQLRGGERMVSVDPEGKRAISIFRPVSVYQDSSLVEVELKTGRTHQIRVHGQHIGHPLAGDQKYGDEQFNRSMRAVGLRRMLLHAHMIEFVDPYDDQVITVSSPLDENARAVLGHLES
ncbi:MAG: 23S rRNA pseudouridine(955/2504/2580) synthase RluC [Gammaproteobacteria bacterium]|jgi:23S rRNA pseudouridine955/2504/2580 synthase|nr:23S rRNA pseudouridine(955/2504/2580) synthase RluC [Gammaproteobacteria bacterium]MDH3888574.1 23S rRNA pseudouridine(955/2504/2580) synthase RluC [Gammaproteobacteria bacterium]MDH3933987.1 23S rRNA pseudouridine(955/2504/2580) synthase RluC [Gammaproteobacteria bacterium]MDH3985563.1 23S rRNA pseudouridine(955/2504/2580) synthase RluC [Gammaproteobacteria bacterium]